MTGTTYSSHDMYFVSYLLCAGVPLISATREGGRLVWTLDASHHDIAALTYAWVSGQAKVVASSYAERIKALKSMAMGGSR